MNKYELRIWAKNSNLSDADSILQREQKKDQASFSHVIHLHALYLIYKFTVKA